jgi:hypothetical protein
MGYGYETTDNIGRGLTGEFRGRETFYGRQRNTDIGRPRGAAYSATARPTQAEVSDAELRRMKLRLLALEAQ